MRCWQEDDDRHKISDKPRSAKSAGTVTQPVVIAAYLSTKMSVIRIIVITALMCAATVVYAQPTVHPADRMLLKIGIGAGYGGGLTYAVPSFYSDYPCYDSYYRCGGYVAGYSADGDFDYEVLSTHTFYLNPYSRTDPYFSGFAGFGSGYDDFGMV